MRTGEFNAESYLAFRNTPSRSVLYGIQDNLRPDLMGHQALTQTVLFATITSAMNFVEPTFWVGKFTWCIFSSALYPKLSIKSNLTKLQSLFYRRFGGEAQWPKKGLEQARNLQL